MNQKMVGHLLNEVVHQMMNHLMMSEHQTMDVRQNFYQLGVRRLFVDVNQTQMKQKLLVHPANQPEAVKA